MFKLLIMVFCIIIAIRLLYNKRKLIKELSTKELVLSIVAYLAAVLIAFVCIYYVGNGIAKSFANTFLQYTIFIIIVLITMAFVQTLLHKTVNKVTGGKLFNE